MGYLINIFYFFIALYSILFQIFISFIISIEKEDIKDLNKKYIILNISLIIFSN